MLRCHLLFRLKFGLQRNFSPSVSNSIGHSLSVRIGVLNLSQVSSLARGARSREIGTWSVLHLFLRIRSCGYEDWKADFPSPAQEGHVLPAIHLQHIRIPKGLYPSLHYRNKGLAFELWSLTSFSQALADFRRKKCLIKPASKITDCFSLLQPDSGMHMHWPELLRANGDESLLQDQVSPSRTVAVTKHGKRS